MLLSYQNTIQDYLVWDSFSFSSEYYIVWGGTVVTSPPWVTDAPAEDPPAYIDYGGYRYWVGDLIEQGCQPDYGCPDTRSVYKITRTVL